MQMFTLWGMTTRTIRIGRPPRARNRLLFWAAFGVGTALFAAAGLWVWFHAGAEAGLVLAAVALMFGLSRTRRR